MTESLCTRNISPRTDVASGMDFVLYKGISGFCVEPDNESDLLLPGQGLHRTQRFGMRLSFISQGHYRHLGFASWGKGEEVRHGVLFAGLNEPEFPIMYDDNFYIVPVEGDDIDRFVLIQ